MAEIAPITDDAGYERASARAGQLMNNWANEEELAELKALGKELSRYGETRFARLFGPTDGPDEIAYLIDMGFATLEDLLPIFGGMERFIEYMTRKTNIDGETRDAIAANFNTEREQFDKPFCSPEGWQEINIPPAPPPCEDLECRNSHAQHDWRAELTRIGRMMQDNKVVA